MDLFDMVDFFLEIEIESCSIICYWLHVSCFLNVNMRIHIHAMDLFMGSILP